MIGIGFGEIVILMIVGGFWLLVLLAVVAVVAKRRGSPDTAPRPPDAPRPHRAPGLARLPLFIAIWIFSLICLVVAVGGAFFFGVGNQPLWSMIVVGLLLFGLFTAVLIGTCVIAIIRQSSANIGPAPKEAIAPFDADARQTIIARLTQRFCPQCRSPLDPDAPEGLCPACLMAGGLASAVVSPPVNGLAATTPPSGSHPPASGEWADLSQHFPHLEILELLGRGGMGTVYKARQKNLDRIVALKVIPPDAAKDPAFTERFNREARAMARMNHPNIVTVYDFGQTGGVFWLLMEYVDGVNLRHALRANRLAPREALAIVPQVCDALQFAHDQGVVHRDIKPENVLLDRTGRVKIADFGLAKLLGKGPNDFTLTHTQQVMGTPRYMAPEQIEKPSTVDHRADIYSLGVVLYEMLTGELPLGRFEPPSHKVEVDVRIDQVVLRALEKSPERRYQRASEVKTELASAVSWPVPAAPAAIPAATTSATPPAWHTPSPAVKESPTGYPSYPGGVPLGQVLFVAFGMVLGVLMMTAGLAAGIFSVLNFKVLPEWWGWMGAAFGCLVGGFGFTAGSYNTYRQMTGAEDLLRSPARTWFDWVMRGYVLLGLALLAAGLFCSVERTIDEFALPLLLFGGIATFQATLFLIWRMLIRPAAAAGTPMATSAEREIPAEPGYLRAVLWPTLAMAAVFGVLLADVHFALPIPRSQGGITATMTAYRQWYEALVITGLVTVPLCLVVLGAWRTWGPRHAAADGRWTVPFPFAHRGWLWAVAGLATLSLFLPWFRLEVVPSAEVALSTKDIVSGATSYLSFVAKADQLRDIAAMPAGGRFSMRGMQEGLTAAAATLLIFLPMMSAFAFQQSFPARVTVLLLAGGIALLLVTNLLHWAADQREQVVVDEATKNGLQLLAAKLHGSQPTTIEPWKHAVRGAILARPTFGALAILAACGLAIFIGVTELSWGAVTQIQSDPQTPPPASLALRKAVEVDPARAAILRRVSGPGIGLIITGLVGFLPVVLALLAIPTWTLTPIQSGPSYREPLEFLDRRLQTPPAPSGFLPLGAATAPTGTLAITGPSAFAPLIFAQESAMTSVGLMAPIAALLLILNLAFSVTLIVGGWRMRQLKSYGLAVIAAVLAMLPCTLGWIIGLPMGIWAFSTLARNEVRDAFES